MHFIFLFFILFLIYAIHLLHLGSRKVNTESDNKILAQSNNLYRADIVDINGNYIAKTVGSIDIGISPNKIINEKIIIKFKVYFS